MLKIAFTTQVSFLVQRKSSLKDYIFLVHVEAVYGVEEAAP